MIEVPAIGKAATGGLSSDDGSGMNLFRTLEAREIECRAQQVRAYSCTKMQDVTRRYWTRQLTP